MADFPRVRVYIGSDENVLDEALVSRSRAGRLRVRRLYPSQTRTFAVQLRGLTDAERDAVDGFLSLNRMNAFNFYWPRKKSWFQVVWTDSGIKWSDQGARLSQCDLTFALV